MTCQIVSAQTVRQWLDAGEAVLVDVREPIEFSNENIVAAVNVPQVGFDLAKVPSAKRVVLHCKSGMRQQAVAAGLEACGKSEGVFLLDGGIEGWKSAGLPTRVAQRQRLSIMRQVQIIVGLMVLAGVSLGIYVDPRFFALALIPGAGLTIAGLTGSCMLATVLSYAPWNRDHRGVRSCEVPSGS